MPLKPVHWIAGVILSSVVLPLYAAGFTPDIRSVANNSLDPVSAVTDIIYNICYLLGVGLFLGGVSKYLEHRNNPGAVPLGQCFVWWILGIITFCLPFIARLSNAAPT